MSAEARARISAAMKKEMGAKPEGCEALKRHAYGPDGLHGPMLEGVGLLTTSVTVKNISWHLP
jgi:hypothetical protein